MDKHTGAQLSDSLTKEKQDARGLYQETYEKKCTYEVSPPESLKCQGISPYLYA